jgi:hypothetical protein
VGDVGQRQADGAALHRADSKQQVCNIAIPFPIHSKRFKQRLLEQRYPLATDISVLSIRALSDLVACDQSLTPLGRLTHREAASLDSLQGLVECTSAPCTPIGLAQGNRHDIQSPVVPDTLKLPHLEPAGDFGLQAGAGQLCRPLAHRSSMPIVSFKLKPRRKPRRRCP